MKVYVINMQRSTHRRKAMEGMLNKHKLQYEFIDAVDGRTLSEEEFVGHVTDPKEFTRSQAGCALSHIKAYRKILEGNDQYGLILEDDVLIQEPHFIQLLKELEQKVDEDSVTVLTYFWCRDGYLDLSKKQGLSITTSTNSYDICTPSEIHGIGRAAAYIVSKKVCKSIIKVNYPLYAQADSWVVFQREGAIKSVDCIYPMPIVENEQFGSEIGYTKNAAQAFVKKVIEIMVNNNIPIITPMIKKRRKQYSDTFKNIRLIA